MFEKKTIEEVGDQIKAGSGLKRSLGVADLIFMGLGAIVGVGIFVLSGYAAAEFSGPAVVVSLLLGCIIAIAIALAFTEVAAIVPTSGGAYAYSYVAIGEFFAWIVGWMTMLYLALSSITVSSGWSGYLQGLLELAGLQLPFALTHTPSKGGMIDLPAVFIALVSTIVLTRGTKESASLNGFLVIIKALVIFIFIVVAIPYFNLDTFFAKFDDYDTSKFMSSHFMPNGLVGVISGTAYLMFAYNGFDCIASAVEECKNPERDVKIGLLSALLLSGVIYILIAGMLVGIVPYSKLNVPYPLAYALEEVGSSIGSLLVGIGAVFGMAAVILMQMYSLSRTIYVMSRDGMLPAILSKVHPKFNTPHITTITLGIIIAIFAGFTPLNVAGALSNIGALFMFASVSLCMIVMRYTLPNVNRPFKCPMAIWIGGGAILICAYLIYPLLINTYMYVFGWIVLGVVMYFIYVANFSNLALKKRKNG